MNHESVARVEFRLYAMITNTFIPVFHDSALSRIGSKSEMYWLFPTSKIRVGNGSPLVCMGIKATKGFGNGRCGRYLGLHAESGCFCLPGTRTSKRSD